jgi:endonuclease/exonuclease/phosphatase family metal-dependent hydrolase
MKRTFNMDVCMKFSLLLLLVSIHGWMQTANAAWSVSTYNIRNFDRDQNAGQTNINELTKIIREAQSDVMAFEEVVNLKAFDALMKKALPNYQYQVSDCGGFGKQHLAVAYNPKTFEYLYSREDLEFTGTPGKCGSLRPLFLVSLREKKTNTIYTFGAVHLKAGGDQRAFQQRWKQYGLLEKLQEKFENQNLVLLGDFNTTGYSIKDADFDQFESFLSRADFRTLGEQIECTSYWKGNLGGKEHQPSTLDHIVVQSKNLRSVEKVTVGSHCARLNCRPATPNELGTSYNSVSDHCPVQVTFK